MGLLGTIVGAVGGLLGDGINYGSQSSTNKTNKEIAQMNNEWNERMLQKQMDYNTEMWNKQNEYNSAKNQRARLEAAGLNPYLMMSGGNAGTAQSANGVNPPQAQQVQMQAPQVDLSTPAAFLQQALELQSVKRQRDADSSLKEQQAAQVGIENKYKAMSMLSDIYERIEHSKNLKHDTEAKEIANRFALETFNSDVAAKAHNATNMKLLGDVYRADIAMKGVQKAIADKQLHWIDSTTQMNIAEALSRIGLNKAQARSAVQGILESKARTAGIHISNDVARRTADTIVDRAYYETGISEGRSAQEQTKAKINRHGEWAGNIGITKLLDTIFGY